MCGAQMFVKTFLVPIGVGPKCLLDVYYSTPWDPNLCSTVPRGTRIDDKIVYHITNVCVATLCVPLVLSLPLAIRFILLTRHILLWQFISRNILVTNGLNGWSSDGAS